MKDFETLYTIADIAEMTGLTDRTIRNYLKDGKLTGRKVGGQWRFTKANIEALMQQPQTGKQLAEAAEGEWQSFIDGETCAASNPDVCTVLDLECDVSFAAEIAGRIASEIDDPLNEYTSVRFNYTYNDSTGKARYYLRGNVEFVVSMLKLIRKQTRKGRDN